MFFAIKILLLHHMVVNVLGSSINSIFTSKNIRPDKVDMSAELMESLINGAELAFGECQQNFKWDRWNCPESAFSRRGDEPATRETAYVLAVTSAAVAHSVARACARGTAPHACGCSTPELHGAPPEGSRWRWATCPDYLKHGEYVSQTILDALERPQGGLRTIINRHNNAIGRHTLRASVRRECRCHGVSGSCSMQTCWLQAAPFDQVAAALRDEYQRALHLHTAPTDNSATAPTPSNKPIISNNRLIYLVDSPDYCKPNKTTGWAGTRGRACSRNVNSATIAERRSCKHLCRQCGHRVRRDRKNIISRCNCTFQWCCEVTCDTCTHSVTEFFCD